MKLKICGMRDNPLEMLPLAPDYLGFIFWGPSPRYFGGKIPELPQQIKKTGVFVDAPLEEVLESTKEFALGALQLHGKESPEYCRGLRELTADGDAPPEIIKAFALDAAFDFSILEPYRDPCDLFLFDSRGPLPGGNGFGFDWSLLGAYPLDRPFLLSGGIGPGSVEQLLEFFQSPASAHCIGLDVNSRFEIRPGLKDAAALKKFKTLLSKGPKTKNK